MSKSPKLYTNIILVTLLFIVFSGWWYYLNYVAIEPGFWEVELYSASYGILALIGAICGLNIARSWGGFKSALGATITLLSLGLLFQELGQLSYSYYSMILGVEIPYPSIGDFWYYGTIPVYIYATIKLARTLNIKFTKELFKKNIISILLPLVLLLSSYKIFLSGYDYINHDFGTTFLSVMYPLGQSLYLSIALLIYILSRKSLGGKLKSNVLLILMALCSQYLADFVFLYTSNRETWLTAGINEYMYLFSYYIMTTAILMLSVKFNKIKLGINGK